MSGHPSYLALDRVALGLRPGPALADHLAHCVRCEQILASHRLAPGLPGWLADLRAPPYPPGKRTSWRRSWVVLPALGAVAVTVLLVVRGPRGGNGDIRPKGTPAVAVYVKRGDTVATWDWKSPVRPDDRLRVGIRPSGFTHVSVASILPAPAPPEILYAGPLDAGGESLLPLSFRVDQRGHREEMSVILSTHPIDPVAHVSDAASPQEGVWSLRLYIPKEARP